jgi:hypothetical protein
MVEPFRLSPELAVPIDEGAPADVEVDGTAGEAPHEKIRDVLWKRQLRRFLRLGMVNPRQPSVFSVSWRTVA